MSFPKPASLLDRFPRRSLGLRLTLTVAAAGLAISTVLAGVLLAVSYHRELGELENTFAYIGERQAPEIGRSVWTFNSEATEASLHSLLSYNHVTAIELLESGRVTVTVGRPGQESLARDIPLKVHIDGSERVAGHLRVHADLGGLRASLLAAFAGRFAGILLVLAVVMGLTLWILDRQVTRHLRIVSRFVGRLSPETLDSQMFVSRRRGPADNDELDQLIDGIGRMQSSLRGSISSLEQSLARQQAAQDEVRQLNATLENKVAERTADLELERQRGNAVMALTRSGYFDRDPQTDRVRLNDFARDLLGLSGRDARPMAELARMMESVSPDMARQFLHWTSLRPHEPGFADFEGPIRRAGESDVVWLHIRREAHGAGGDLRFGAIQDITANVHARLELAEARDAAEQANRSKSEFLANMSHEIRTPLNGMLGMVQLLERSGLDARQAGFVGKLRFSADILLGVINDILDFSKIEAGQLGIERVPFDVHEVVTNAVALIRTRAEEKGLTVSLELDPALPACLVSDPLRIAQVLSNLGGNAVKFTLSGAISVRVAYRPVAEGGMLCVEVEDTGIGMNEAEAQRLFQPFAQADGSISRRFGGTGLGLAICRRLVEAMGGTINVRSQPGAGSVFHFEIACRPGSAEAIRPAAAVAKVARPAALLHGLTILVVDDNPINRDVAGEMLSGAGARVVTAEDGQQALDRIAGLQAEGVPIAAVLMDIQMPVMDGFAATARLRQQPETARLPIIAMTAHGLSGDRERSLAAGMDDHVAKPVHYDALLDTVLRWARAASGGAPAPGPSPSPMPVAAAPAPALPDTDLVRPSEALPRMNNNRDAYLRLLGMYVAQYSGFADEYRAGGSLDERAAIAHRLKGSAGALGMPVLQALAAEHEDRQRAGETLPAAEDGRLLELVARSCAEAGDVLRRFAPPQPVAATMPAVVAGRPDALREVREHLQRFSRPPAPLLADMLTHCENQGKNVTTFKARLAAFDLAGAAAALDELFKEKLQ